MNSVMKKQTSFHSIALNISCIVILTICHLYVPYIHELVFPFFNGLFLILSISLFFYINLLLRTSSITCFTYFSLLARIFTSICIFSFLIILIAFFTNTIEIIQRIEFARFLVFLFTFSLLVIISAKFIYSLIKPKGNLNVILLTDHSDVEIKKVYNFLKNNHLNVTQFHTDEFNQMIKFVIDNQIEAVYLTVHGQNLNAIELLIKDLSLYSFKLFWILPSMFFTDHSGVMASKIVLLNESPVFLDTNQYLLKRSIDVFGSILLLLLLFPFILIVSIAIKLTDNGPILYFQKRHGQNGNIFQMIKFRSMQVNTHNPDLQVSNDDDRVTPIGKLIRKTSFDEIPQLANILRGDMSLVGPRPQTVDEIAMYTTKLSKFLTRHHVKPGLTGLAQIRSRVKTDSLLLMNEKLESDLEYIKHWSLYLDLKILINTPFSIWKNKDSNT